VAKGVPADRKRVLDDKRLDVVALGRDNIGDAAGRSFRTVIIDESSGFKSRASKRWKVAKDHLVFQPGCDHVWELTGTPTPNGYLDLWPQIALLDKGARLGRNITTYRKTYFDPGRPLPNGVIPNWYLKPGAADEIKSRVADICLSMETDDRVYLPELTHNEIVIDLPHSVKQIYRKLKKELVVNLDMIGGEVHSAANEAVLSSKLSQISAGFLFVDDADIRGRKYQHLHNERTNAVAEVVEGTGSNVLVFYRFTPERDALMKALPQAKLLSEPGVIEDWNRGQVPVMLAHPASAGHGLNLQDGGSTIVWSSPTWNAEEWEQGNKRLHRSGQRHPVVIHSIMAKRTIDYLTAARRDGKVDVQDDLLAHLESPI
jgi:SNF2 family DNA or RNA helicase